MYLGDYLTLLLKSPFNNGLAIIYRQQSHQDMFGLYNSDSSSRRLRLEMLSFARRMKTGDSHKT